MHFTGTVYRNPYWPTWPLLEITQGCTHNQCKFCTMYKDVPFRMSPMEWIEEDLQELACFWQGDLFVSHLFLEKLAIQMLPGENVLEIILAE